MQRAATALGAESKWPWLLSSKFQIGASVLLSPRLWKHLRGRGWKECRNQSLRRSAVKQLSSGYGTLIVLKNSLKQCTRWRRGIMMSYECLQVKNKKRRKKRIQSEGDCWEEKVGCERGSNGWKKVISDENFKNSVCMYKIKKIKLKYEKVSLMKSMIENAIVKPITVC